MKKLSRTFLLLILTLAAIALVALAQQQVVIQGITQQRNTRSVSAANTAVSINLTPPANTGTKAYVYRIEARCSAGTAQLSMTDDGTTIWDIQATGVSTSNFERNFTNPYSTRNPEKVLQVTLGTCGVGNTGTLIVQGAIY